MCRTLAEASEIRVSGGDCCTDHFRQAGDILIAHSTDIAWSLYFPRLAGVITELGGVLSHGDA